MKSFGRSREVQLLGDGYEIAEVAEVDVHNQELYQDVWLSRSGRTYGG